MSDSHADISKHVRSYIMVFIALAVLTIVTVAASRIDFGTGNVVVALLIAVVKASLVATIFMHLKWEKSASIWLTLGLCAFFFVLLMALPVLIANDNPPQVVKYTWDDLGYEEAAKKTETGH